MLRRLSVAATALTELNVRRCAYLRELDVSRTEIKVLDVSRNKRLADLNISGSAITELIGGPRCGVYHLRASNMRRRFKVPFSSLPRLEVLFAPYYLAPKLVESTMSQLVDIRLPNADLHLFSTPFATQLRFLDVSSTKIKVLDTRQFVALRVIILDLTRVRYLDCSACKYLEGIAAHGVALGFIRAPLTLTRCDFFGSRINFIDMRDCECRALRIDTNMYCQ